MLEIRIWKINFFVWIKSKWKFIKAKTQCICTLSCLSQKSKNNNKNSEAKSSVRARERARIKGGKSINMVNHFNAQTCLKCQQSNTYTRAHIKAINIYRMAETCQSYDYYICFVLFCVWFFFSSFIPKLQNRPKWWRKSKKKKTAATATPSIHFYLYQYI